MVNAKKPRREHYLLNFIIPNTMLAKTLPLRLSPATYFMSRHTLLLLVLGLAAFLFIVPGTQAASLTENETLKLPSGHTVKVLSVSKIQYSTGVMALMVRYETKLTVDQENKALSQEVDDVWKLTVKDVERYGYHEAIISSNEVPKGIFVTSTRMLNFLYEKGSDGRWTRLSRPDFMAAE